MADDFTLHRAPDPALLTLGRGSETGNVLVGFDGSLASEHAVAFAGGLALRTGARLLIANVDRPSEIGRGFASLAGYPLDPYFALGPSLAFGREYTGPRPASDDKASRLERQVRCILGSRAAPWTLLQRTGRVADELRLLADEYHADAVVVGKSRQPFRHVFGSIAARLARRCAQPVLIIP